MTPDVMIVGVETDSVLWMKHDGKVSELHIAAVSCQYAEAIKSGIIAHTLDGEVHLLCLSLYLKSDGGASQCVHIVLFDGSDDADGERAGLSAFLIST